MAAYGESILSKVLDDGNVLALREYDVRGEDFGTSVERGVHEFITKYAKDNRGKVPDYRTVVEHYPDFYYRADVSDEYRYLVRELKSFSAKRKLIALIEGAGGKESLEKRVNSQDGNELLLDLKDEFQKIVEDTAVREKVGISIKTDTASYLTEYRARRDGTSVRIWQSKFATISFHISGYFSGNCYAWFGRSGRGKSVFVMEEALESAMNGATVLVWAMEMGRFEWMARAYASLSARTGIIKGELDGIVQDIGFHNQAMLSGSLTPAMEEALEEFLTELRDFLPGDIILRAVDDEDFGVRTVRQLESDIIQTGADVVVVDPFYYLQYEANTSRTTGGDAANTSMALRALAGRTKTVIHVITQADEDGQQSDEDRELSAPARSSVKKTKAILEDSANLFAIDTMDGRGIIVIGKGRTGGEGAYVEVTYMPSHGIVRELGEDLASIAMELGM